MPIIDDADVQVFLPVDTLKIEEIPDDKEDCKQDAERIVRGTLAGVIDSAELSSWVDPDSTPEIIRAAAGRLCAALIYRLRFGGQGFEDPEYAQVKYNEAMAILNGIIAGTIAVDGVLEASIDNTWFQPNDATGDPKFTMAGRY